MDKIIVYLSEDWGNLDEGYAFKVDQSELWTEEDIEYRGKSMYGFVEVTTEYDETYYIEEDVVETISERMA